MSKQKIMVEIENALKNLPLKKRWQINQEGIKIKVVRSHETAFETYHNGHYVTTDESWDSAFELVKVLLQAQ